ncbi:MAG: hypothetical protein JNJ73_08350 [Hyphomonadaceae bacterium]|nr:hypothetical protein [Hyphomonadaceae bacterium]
MRTMPCLLALGALALAGCATTAHAPASPEERLAMANAEARGGIAAIGAVEAIDIRLRMHEGALDLTGHYRANRSGCMRIDVAIDGNVVFTEALGRNGGWHMTRNMEREAPNTEAGNAALRHGVESPTRLFGLNEYGARGHQLSLGSPETIDGALYQRLDVEYKDGYRAALFLDPQTHLVMRVRETKPLHVDEDATAKRVETRLSDYREVAGVFFPFRSEEVDLDTGETLSTTEIASLGVNTDEALAICSSPPPV